MQIPTIHVNGTPRVRLLEALCDANNALLAAEEAVASTAPNARDYYRIRRLERERGDDVCAAARVEVGHLGYTGTRGEMPHENGRDLALGRRGEPHRQQGQIGQGLNTASLLPAGEAYSQMGYAIRSLRLSV